MTNKVNLLSTANTPQGNDIVGFIGHNTIIVGNRAKWSECSFGFLIQLIGIRNLCNRANKHLGRKFKRGLVDVVNFVMEFEIVKDAFRPSDIRNSVADRIGFTNSFEKQICLFSSWKKLDFQRQFHSTKIQLFSDIRKYIRIIINQKKESGAIPPLA